MYFERERKLGEQGQSDFTDMSRLGVTIRGEAYPHLLYRFVLAYSNWERVELAVSETFEALAGGLQESLWDLGGVRREHRTGNLSAATHSLRQRAAGGSTTGCIWSVWGTNQSSCVRFTGCPPYGRSSQAHPVSGLWTHLRPLEVHANGMFLSQPR